jgi:hypothetical protein
MAEYSKIGKEYPDHINDQLYRHFCQLVAWDKNKVERINNITRVKRFDNTEWLIYNQTDEGHDKVYGKKHVFFRSGLGKFLQIDTETVRVPNEEFVNNPTTDIEFDIDGKPKTASEISMFREVTNVIGEHEAYSIPFTKENLDKLHKKCKDKGTTQKQDEITSYAVAREGGINILVTDSYEHFRNGDFETLFNYGGIPSKEERYRIDSFRMNRVGNQNQNNIPFSSQGSTTSEEDKFMTGVMKV